MFQMRTFLYGVARRLNCFVLSLMKLRMKPITILRQISQILM